jgi:D-glycero-alpha-D-manno-heptose-7-phosphate kinase
MIISRAPLRISFFGGGTDFPEYFCKESGAVLATAIDKYSFVTASQFQSNLFDYAVRISYRKNECVPNIAEIQHPVFRECLRLLKLERDIELHTVADLPAFTGLGSSSTFTVSLLHSLHAYKGEHVKPLQLAYEAIQIERGVLKESVGCQDQTTAAVGGFNVLEFRSETDIRVHRLHLQPDRIAEFQAHLFIVYTGVKRRAAEIEAKKVQSLDRNRAMLLRMRQMVDEGRDLLTDGGTLEAFGRLLHEAWLAKRSLETSVSNGEIDELYRRGLDAGAWGGKLLGAGGGGFILFLAPPETHPKLREAFADRFIMSCRINAPGSEIVFAN